MPKVSLIVPVYNTEKYLKKCMDSILKQSLDDIEIIVLNDGSPGEVDGIISTYKDKRIKYIKKENEGIGRTRNRGIDEAVGEYLAFVDSDDYIDPDFCEVLYEKAKNDSCDIVVCNYYEDRDSIIELKLPYFSDTNLEENPSVINKINLGPCNKLFKRDLFDNKNNRFIENLKYEDAPLVIRLLLSAKRIGKVDNCLTHYVIHDNSQTTVRDEKIFDILKITEMIIEDFKKYSYMKDEAVNIAVMILADYTIQQRYINDGKLRNKFIDEAFSLLDNLDKNWRECNYLKAFSYCKRFIKTNKLLTKMYCSLYNSKLKKQVLGERV